MEANESEPLYESVERSRRMSKRGRSTSLPDKCRRNLITACVAPGAKVARTYHKAQLWNTRSCRRHVKRDPQLESLQESKSSDGRHSGGLACSSDEATVMGAERRGQLDQSEHDGQRNSRRTRPVKTKPYEITKREVYEAWKRVKRNRGSGGVDGTSLEQFEAKLADNLYKLWNRMSSGSYYPKAVRRVEIPKKDGRTRPLGIPTVYDRVAQEVARARLERELEPIFHRDSYGFRPNKSAHQAVDVCRQRNFDYNWAIDLDIKQYFDTIDHQLLLKAVRKHSKEAWIVLYIERWLKAPVVLPDGREQKPEAGTPQGGVISPLLANLFLHYVFDMWIQRNFARARFERYADDAVIHCGSRKEALEILAACHRRFSECRLTLHPEKTRIAYCRDSYREYKNHPITNYTFLGFQFRPRRMTSKRTGKRLTRFLPGAAPQAKKQLRQKLREKLHRRTLTESMDTAIASLNRITRGWLNYFQPFSSSANLSDIYLYIKLRFTAWLKCRHRWSTKRAVRWLKRALTRDPQFLILPGSRRLGWSRGAV